MDALAIIVHGNNTLDSIHLNELAAIYTGSTKTWGLGSVGNPPITLYGRQSSSGTYSFFREAILKAEYDQSMIGYEWHGTNRGSHS
jgi:phosphate transport system substrate-binding protein